MSTDNDNVLVAKAGGGDDVFDHRDPDGKIRKGVKKFLKESGREDDLLILNFFQGKESP